MLPLPFISQKSQVSRHKPNMSHTWVTFGDYKSTDSTGIWIYYRFSCRERRISHLRAGDSFDHFISALHACAQEAFCTHLYRKWKRLQKHRYNLLPLRIFYLHFVWKSKKISIALSIQSNKFRFQGCLIPLELLKASISHKTVFKTDCKTILCLSGLFATKRNQLRSPNP